MDDEEREETYMMIQDYCVDQLHVRAFDTRQEMGDCAGQEAAACLKRLLAEQDEVNVIFAVAPSQNETLAALCAAEGIDWSRVNAFHMDEYIGLSDTHSASFRHFLRKAIFDRFPFKSVNLIDGSAEDISAELARYTELMNSHPADICILGVGENGHIAFNDPWTADFNDPAVIKAVDLDERCRMQQVHDGCFDRIEDVPRQALTVTIPALCRARFMFCSVPGSTKADAVARMLQGDVTVDCPATILRRHAHAALYIDRDAAAGIL